MDVNPLSLGTDLQHGGMLEIIPRNTKIPTKKSGVVTTVVDYQTRMNIGIYEGERPLAKDNHFLGEFTLTGITPNLASVSEVEITYEIDANGILRVTAQDKANGMYHIVESRFIIEGFNSS